MRESNRRGREYPKTEHQKSQFHTGQDEGGVGMLHRYTWTDGGLCQMSCAVTILDGRNAERKLFIDKFLRRV